MAENVPGRVLREMISLAKKHRVRKITLFGSRARGTHRERSDIDIAVSGGDFDAFYWDIKENIHSLLSFDVIDEDSDVSDELRAEIRRDGKVLYEET